MKLFALYNIKAKICMYVYVCVISCLLKDYKTIYLLKKKYSRNYTFFFHENVGVTLIPFYKLF